MNQQDQKYTNIRVEGETPELAMLSARHLGLWLPPQVKFYEKRANPRNPKDRAGFYVYGRHYFPVNMPQAPKQQQPSTVRTMPRDIPLSALLPKPLTYEYSQPDSEDAHF